MPPAALDTNPFSSSPAFATPAHPIPAKRAPPLQLATAKDTAAKPPTILPIRLPPGTLRPHAFRVFTKKHNLTLASTALAQLADFVGRHCGSGWREEGLAEPVLEEVAKAWKKCSANVIVDGQSKELQSILKTLDSCMSGGRVVQGKSGLSRQTSFNFTDKDEASSGKKRPLTEEEIFAPRKRPSLEGQLTEEAQDEEDEDGANADPRNWLQVVQAFEQPKLAYDTRKKNFEK
jgi:DNA polymerase epsilon subunit 2